MSFKAQSDALTTTTTTTTTTRFIVLLIHKSVKILRENNCEKKRAQPLRNSTGYVTWLLFCDGGEGGGGGDFSGGIIMYLVSKI